MTRTVGFVAGAVLLVAAVWLLGRHAATPLMELLGRIDASGWRGAGLFILIYLFATVALVPGSILSLAAGVLFGLTRGTAYVMLGATAGAAAAFLIARYLARPAVARRVARDDRFARVDRAVEGNGFRIVFLLRLSPLFPFVLLNYALGVTRVRFVDYVLASVGMLPGTLLYVYYGKLAGDVAALATEDPVQRGAGYYALLGIGLLATLAVATYVAKIAGAALRAETGEEVVSGG